MEKCKICNNSFTTNRSLAVHIVRTHKIAIEYYYLHYISKDGIKPKCPICDKEVKFKSITAGYLTFCSKQCINKSSIVREKIKATNLIKYGVEYAQQTTENRIKSSITAKNNSKERINKYKNTCIERYGVDNVRKAKEIQQKMYEAKLVNRPNDPTNREKYKNTCMERYGVENVRQADVVKEKIKQTNVERYGVEYPLSLQEVQEKIVHTNLERYGVERPLQLYEFNSKSKKTYSYDGKQFDSSWELAMYIYAKDNNEDIEREPCKLEYTYNNKTYYYYPDFKYKGELIEIKGGHLFSKENGLIDIFNEKDNNKLNAKYVCMLANGVKILQYDEIKKYIIYCKKTYGKQWCNKYRNK